MNHRPNLEDMEDWKDFQRDDAERERRSGAAGGSAAVTLEQALIHCELWTRSDIELYRDAPFRKNLEHRLKVIQEALATLKGEPPNAELTHRR